jgi:hypothetical protein
VAPQGKLALIDDPAQIDVRLLKRKSVSLHWEFMFTRSMFETEDMAQQHALLNDVSRLVDSGVLKTTVGERFGAINAANLKRAHALLESNRARGKIVLEGFCRARLSRLFDRMLLLAHRQRAAVVRIDQVDQRLRKAACFLDGCIKAIAATLQHGRLITDGAEHLADFHAQVAQVAHGIAGAFNVGAHLAIKVDKLRTGTLMGR